MTAQTKTIPFDDIFEKIQLGADVICANQRLASHITDSYNAYMRQQGALAWETPVIQALPVWLANQFQHIKQSHNGISLMLINAYQQRFIWQSILRQSDALDSLLYTKNIIDDVLDAWRIVNEYEISLTAGAYENQSLQLYIEWQEQYLQYCKQHKLIDGRQLSSFIGYHFDHTQSGDTLIFSGFDSIPAALATLRNRFVTSGKTLLDTCNETRQCKIQKAAFTSLQEEITSAAHWARRQIEQQPDKHIAIITPDLKTIRHEMESALEDSLEGGRPHETTPDYYQRAFDISIGIPLYDYNIIKSACTLLRFLAEGADKHGVSYLLLSPYIIDTDLSLVSRHRIGTEIQQSIQDHFTLYHLSKYLDEEKETSTCRILTQSRQAMDGFKKLNTPANWHSIISEMLQIWGWPGSRELDSQEFQLQQKFISVLHELVSLNGLPEQLSLQECIHYIVNIAKSTIFQAETAASNISVMGLLEATHQHFNEAWLLGFNENAWPATRRPNPFLPAALQRQHHVPHADHIKDAEIYETITGRLLSCADNVVVSYANFEGDQELLPSPFIQQIENIYSPHQAPDSYNTKIYKSTNLGLLADNHGPAFKQNEQIKKGASLLGKQANCPFQAFASIRLKAEDAEPNIPGLNHMERGILAHEVAELFWSRVKDHATLAAMPEDTRISLVRDCCEAAISDNASMFNTPVKTALRDIEQQRLLELFEENLQQELKRSEFTVVATEQAVTLPDNLLSLSLRIDRVDEDADGNHIVIDYKPGIDSLQTLVEERLVNPQLPLYSIYYDKPVQAVLYQQLRRGDCKVSGIRDESIDSLKIKTVDKVAKSEVNDWAALQSQWQHSIESTITEFLSGLATVSPLNRPSSCNHCGLQSLCRIHEESENHHE